MIETGLSESRLMRRVGRLGLSEMMRIRRLPQPASWRFPETYAKDAEADAMTKSMNRAIVRWSPSRVAVMATQCSRSAQLPAYRPQFSRTRTFRVTGFRID